MTAYFCCNENRREAVRASGLLNGIDFIEVVDGEGVPEPDRQRILRVHLINPPSPALLAVGPRNVVIDGGVRVTRLRALTVSWSGQVLTVRVDRPGDFSAYALRLATNSGGVLAGMDALLSEVAFSFKVECPFDFDCAVAESCPPLLEEAPEIDYLARDYGSFRQLMFDRLAVVAPGWRERNPSDLGVALVEALAYSADHLSYQLDATGMEATLTTARLRTSARRHARLVDYRTHDGSNARTWVQLRAAVGQAGVVVPAGTQLLTRVPGLGPLVAPNSPGFREALQVNPAFFETMHEATLDASRNEIPFYTWGDDECCLASGADSATLRGHPALAPGDLLVFVERLGPRTGAPADADPAHRHAVRLTEVRATSDPLGGQFESPKHNNPVPVTEISWHREDALPFSLCISSRAGETLLRDVSVALGNIVLADHGRTFFAEKLPKVPEPDPRLAIPSAGGESCDRQEPRQRPARFILPVPEPDLTMTGTIGRPLPGGDPRAWATFDRAGSAASARRWESRHILPAITVADEDGRSWRPARDLLGSGPFGHEFVAEVEANGFARLRFGDGEYGMRPRAKTVFDMTFRRGNGPAGNIGADSLAHVVSTDPRIEAVRNPLPAAGGTSPEALERTRQDAPEAFKIQERAVTPEDYAAMAARHPGVQRAVATERYTGSWYTMFITIDRRDGLPVDTAFEAGLRAFLERFRMAGHDVEIDGPRFVPLEVVLRVCALPDYYRFDVARAVLDALSRFRGADGRGGFFHPDNFTFGQPVTLSALLAAAQAVEGVHFVEPVTFRRLGDAHSDVRRAGEVAIGRLEIARLDNDPSFAERGTLQIQMEGGR